MYFNCFARLTAFQDNSLSEYPERKRGLHSERYLEKGEEKTVSFTIRADQFAFVGRDGEWVVEAGDMEVMVGSSSNHLPLKDQFCISESKKIRPAKRGFYARADVK